MHLKSIKLAGFKSFVDPTNITLPSELVGIVGPNGCGKSNVIDAVRWVMGESSAKYLRGESMTDVIFNGSNARKPVGKAHVELIFDNSDKSLKGEYANYNEISIKRTVNRESQSTYYLNGTRCRRRDIVDIFLGTGLGPRSYSIIEQGMISRLIEAKPEELRAYLEEAAGISKYKERRRETENRIRHTQENLERLSDIREELEKQLKKLDAQAKAAEKFKAFKQEERDTSAGLAAMRWQQLNSKLTKQKEVIEQQELQHEAEVAEIRHCDAEIEKQREIHANVTETFNDVQSRFYQIGSEIARIEQEVAHVEKRDKELKEELQTAKNEHAEAKNSFAFEQSRLNELINQATQVEPELVAANNEATEVQKRLEAAEHALSEWQQTWDTYHSESSKTSEQAHMHRAEVQNAERFLEQITQREGRIGEEISTLNEAKTSIDLSELSGEMDNLLTTESQLTTERENANETIANLREAVQAANESLHQAQREERESKGRLASLEALQEVALGKKDKSVSRWFAERGLADKARLAEKISVKKGYETAVETVLGPFLEAICLDDLGELDEHASNFPEAEVLFVSTDGSPSANTVSASMLADKVLQNDEAKSLLQGVYVVDAYLEAKALLSQLKSSESVICKDGLWLGKNWVRVSKKANARQGIIEREQDIRELKTTLSKLNETITSLETERDSHKEKQRESEQILEQVHQQLSQVQRQLAELRSEYRARETKLEQIKERVEKAERELSEGVTQKQQEEDKLKDARASLESVLDDMHRNEERREALIRQRDELQSSLQHCRSASHKQKEVVHQLALKKQSLMSQTSSVKEHLERLNKQITQLDDKHQNLSNILSKNIEPLDTLQEKLQANLARRLDEENTLTTLKARLTEAEHNLRTQEAKRSQAEQRINNLRSALEKARLDWQALEMKADAETQKLAELNCELQATIDALDPMLTQQDLDEKLAQIQRRIERLGPINLVAIDEYEKQSERKQYLDSQHEDLEEALNTLTRAIEKIDKETKARFKETFDHVNESLGRLFPKVFGGGQAYLELTGTDLLDTGVAIIARPPGKRNSSIHLLSGGEKALTAIALVFSIFSLNPSPFCMLDEVDAPLDDANVGRFCALIKEMSEQVQFIFISHNKITMELATHLMGVTAKEPGVSRIVSVDLEEAAELAES